MNKIFNKQTIKELFVPGVILIVLAVISFKFCW